MNPMNQVESITPVKGKRGGFRVGAGRKPGKKPETAVVTAENPLDFLQQVMLGKIEVTSAQLRAAIAAAQYVHVKKGDSGRKEEVEKDAKKAAGGKFAPTAPPRLVVNG